MKLARRTVLQAASTAMFPLTQARAQPTRKKLKVGSETYMIPETHVFKKPGTYKFTYTIRYCGTKGWFPTTATTQLVVR